MAKKADGKKDRRNQGQRRHSAKDKKREIENRQSALLGDNRGATYRMAVQLPGGFKASVNGMEARRQDGTQYVRAAADRHPEKVDAK